MGGLVPDIGNGDNNLGGTKEIVDVYVILVVFAFCGWGTLTDFEDQDTNIERVRRCLFVY